MGDTKDKSINPPPAKSRSRRTSVGESENNDKLQQILDQMGKMREENVKLAEGLKDQVKQDMQNMREEMRGEVNNIRKTLDEVVEKVKTEVRTEVRAEMETMRERLEKSERHFDDVSSRMEKQATITAGVCDDLCHFNNIIEKLGEKIIDLESRGKRNNYIFHGVKEKDGESCKHVVHRLISEHCNIKGSVDQVIQRAHRIGAERAGKIRPLIALFVNWNDKEIVRENKRNLPEGIYCTDDEAYEVREARRKLQPEVAAAYARGQRAWIAYPARLIVNGVEVKRETPRYTGIRPNNRRDDAPAFGRHRPPPHVFGQATNEASNDRRNHARTTVSHDVSVMTSPADFAPRCDESNQVQDHEKMDDSPPVEGAVGGARATVGDRPVEGAVGGAPAPEGDRPSQEQNVVVGEGGV